MPFLSIISQLNPQLWIPLFPSVSVGSFGDSDNSYRGLIIVKDESNEKLQYLILKGPCPSAES